MAAKKKYTKKGKKRIIKKKGMSIKNRFSEEDHDQSFGFIFAPSCANSARIRVKLSVVL